VGETAPISRYVFHHSRQDRPVNQAQTVRPPSQPSKRSARSWYERSADLFVDVCEETPLGRG